MLGEPTRSATNSSLTPSAVGEQTRHIGVETGIAAGRLVERGERPVVARRADAQSVTGKDRVEPRRSRHGRNERRCDKEGARKRMSGRGRPPGRMPVPAPAAGR